MKSQRWYYAVQLFLDLIFVLLGYFIGFKLQRTDIVLHISNNQLLISFLSILVISMITFIIYKPYRCGKIKYLDSIFNVIISLIMIAILAVFVDYLIKGIGIWRRTAIIALGIQIGILLVCKYIAFKLHEKIFGLKDILIIGKDIHSAARFALKLLESHDHIYKLKHFVDEKNTNIYHYIDSCENIFVCSDCDLDIRKKIFNYCLLQKKICHVNPDFDDIIINAGIFETINDMFVLRVLGKLDVESKATKRAIDVVISILILFITSPILVLVAACIKLQDGGKVFYKQTRVTEDNRLFELIKFRSMIKNAEEKTGIILCSKNDPRVTPIGKIIRAIRLDEVPQLINVLKGDMSLIGPRPERPEMIEEIQKDLPDYQYRTMVKAGITGLAQVLGRYNTTFKDKLAFDLYYIKNYSLALDVKILFNTIRTIVTPSSTVGIDEEGMDAVSALKELGYNIDANNEKIA